MQVILSLDQRKRLNLQELFSGELALEHARREGRHGPMATVELGGETR